MLLLASACHRDIPGDTRARLLKRAAHIERGIRLRTDGGAEAAMRALTGLERSRGVTSGEDEENENTLESALYDTTASLEGWSDSLPVLPITTTTTGRWRLWWPAVVIFLLFFVVLIVWWYRRRDNTQHINA